ncbi:MAG TPA: elongation factor P maturation arginine rhamnosyltransferase EarP [Usitatibacter sp.]|nr:elongation factor P maturation arginine rhamnosyltransferase EarP [Usitatibacter sp.]
MENPPERWDVFCRVVDNYGDVGVSWRLARQLAREHGKRVRLWIDDLVVMAKLRPELDAAYDQQALEGVEVCRLREPFVVDEVADVVVETFGCDPPPAYVQAMAERRVRPRWINLEYLSAEDWVEQSHALPSPHPRLPLVKHYFFPGFTPRTAGLLREAGLIERRDAFQSDPGAQAAFWRSVVGKVPPAQALKVSLFTYLGAPVDGLARSCRQYAGPVWLIAPEGAAATALRGWTGRDSIRRNDHGGGLRRELEVFEVPFLPQDSYDLLLWSCDVNFVRGEDSFVRAHWAGRPFVWNVYPTDDGAHWVKMAAFLARFTEGLDADRAGAVSALHEAWNRGDPPLSGEKAPPPLGDAWSRFLGHREALGNHAAGWCRRLAARPDLVSELVDFCDNVLK